MKWDPGVAADGEKREIRVEIGGNRATYGFTLDYDTAHELRDMITDALEHIEGCDRRKNPPELP